MEPSYNAPQPSAERYLPPVVNPEQGLEATPARYEQESQRQERQPIAEGQQVQPPLTAPPILPPPISTQVLDPASQTVVSDVPDVAADDDLIEKQWVDKAKQIISETADDPHRREAAIAELQREYLRKRYGKELGASE